MARTLTLTLTPELEQKLQKLSQECECSMADVVRASLTLMEDVKKPRPKDADPELFEESEDAEEDEFAD